MKKIQPMIAKYYKLRPAWSKSVKRSESAQDALVSWRSKNKTLGVFKIDNIIEFSAVCGSDAGIEYICNHYESLKDNRTPEQRDTALEAAIDRLNLALVDLQTIPSYTEYREARNSEQALYWELIDLENEILAYPAIKKTDLLAKAKWMQSNDWSELENIDAFEYLLKSFQAIAESVN